MVGRARTGRRSGVYLSAPQETYRPLFMSGLWVPAGAAVLAVTYAISAARPFQVAAFGILLGLAALVLGLLLGFLFGIPRALQGGEDPAFSRAAYATNTNLEQISDWLTKILVGVGLVELARAPDALGRASQALGSGLGGGEAAPTAAGVIVVLNAGWGFLLGYMATRTYLTDVFTDFDRFRGFMSDALRTASQVVTDLDFEPNAEAAGYRPPPGAAAPPTHNRERQAEALSLRISLDEVRTLADLRRGAVDLLRRLVGTGVRGSDDDPLLLLALLYRRGVLSRAAYRSLNRFFSLTDDSTAPVSAGEDLTRYRVSDQDRELLRSLTRLGAWAPARFEQHVLSVLVEQAPYDWDLAMDVPLGPDRPDSVRVDSLVRYRSRKVVIEIRASLGAGRVQPLNDLKRWLDKLPPVTAVLLVVPARDAGYESAQRVIRDQERAVSLISWDDEASRFIPEIAVRLGHRRGERE